MFEGTADDGADDELANFLGGYRDYCDSAPAPWPTADLNVWGVNACVSPEIIFRRRFCAGLIEFTKSPCSQVTPDPVACLGDQGVAIEVKIVLPYRVPRTARARSRRSRVIRNRASESSDGGDGAPAGPNLVSSCGVSPPRIGWISRDRVALEIAGQLFRFDHRAGHPLLSLSDGTAVPAHVADSLDPIACNVNVVADRRSVVPSCCRLWRSNYE